MNKETNQRGYIGAKVFSLNAACFDSSPHMSGCPEYYSNGLLVQGQEKHPKSLDIIQKLLLW